MPRQFAHGSQSRGKGGRKNPLDSPLMGAFLSYTRNQLTLCSSLASKLSWQTCPDPFSAGSQLLYLLSGGGPLAEGGGSGMDCELGVNRCKLLLLEWIYNEILLYSTGNYV